MPTVLLLHGSPGSSDDFRTLGPALGRRFNVVAPDLPGFGDSDMKIPDYSIRAHAAYALEVMDRLHLDSAHLLGFSMGGGVALEMIDQAAQRGVKGSPTLAVSMMPSSVSPTLATSTTRTSVRCAVFSGHSSSRR
jgi:pimeloyl-ACP methyl ester carboxylesterase